MWFNFISCLIEVGEKWDDIEIEIFKGWKFVIGFFYLNTKIQKMRLRVFYVLFYKFSKISIF